MDTKAVTQRQKRAVPQECLNDYTPNRNLSENQPGPCYITAELGANYSSSSQIFTIGDGQTYGGYVNHPLQVDRDYSVYIGVMVELEPVSK